jgi:hypothetical protein
MRFILNTGIMLGSRTTRERRLKFRCPARAFRGVRESVDWSLGVPQERFAEHERAEIRV